VRRDARFLTEIHDGLPSGYERVHRVDQRFLGAGSKKVLKSSRSGEEVWVPSVSVFELWYGVAKSMQTDANRGA